MDKLRVHFIRHASGTHMLNPEIITGRSLDAKLTDEGLREAISKGYELARRGVVLDRVVSSPAERCLQTGKAILDTMGIAMPMEPDDRLLEMDQGPNAGRLRSEAYTDAVQWQILAEGKDFALPGAESMNQVGWRGFNWLRSQEVYAGHHSTILALAHVGLIACTASALMGWDQSTTLAMSRSMPPVGETRVAFDGASWQLEAFGESVQE